VTATSGMVWHGALPGHALRKMKFRFCSEFGMQWSLQLTGGWHDVPGPPAERNVFGQAMKENHQKKCRRRQPNIVDYVASL